MALGALIGAYQEDDSGGLRALLPLAGRTLIEYQARCAAAAGAAPIVVVVERIPSALNDAFDRLRGEGISVLPVNDAAEGASRFEPGSLIFLVGDGVAPPAELLAQLALDGEPAVATVPDDQDHQEFERIDGSSRWAGVALVEGRIFSSTAAILGDWDLQSTLLRRTLQDGAPLIAVGNSIGEPLLAQSSDDLADFERRMFVASRGVRRDWASRYVLPLVEELATDRLMQTRVPPRSLIYAALAATVAAAAMLLQGWLWPAIVLLLLSAPLDLIGRRLAVLRLRPLPARFTARTLLWPAAALALLALGWMLGRGGEGWGALFAAIAAAAFAQAARIERSGRDVPGEHWLFSRRNAILAALPFAAAGAMTTYVVALAVYAAGSFFYLQHINHGLRHD